jgi:glycosyltransferase involved in cell wall biosynthesis
MNIRTILGRKAELKRPTVSVIIDTYNRPHLLKQAVEAVFRQTYNYLEIILINNGATLETIEYLSEVQSKDARVKLVHFKENQFSWGDPQKMLDICLNAGLKIATGDLVWYQSDDDLLAEDYLERMVKLFEENSSCMTAAGLPLVMDQFGKKEEPTHPRTSNLRPRYMCGRDLALSSLREGPLFSAPGTIFTIPRELLIKAGGYHRAIEVSQLFGIAAFGVSGFDEKAIFYWRTHSSQLNKQLTEKGYLAVNEILTVLRDWDLKKRWHDYYGLEQANEVHRGLMGMVARSASLHSVDHVYQLRFTPAFRILKAIWWEPLYWKKIPGAFWSKKWRIKWWVKKMFNRLGYRFI